MQFKQGKSWFLYTPLLLWLSLAAAPVWPVVGEGVLLSAQALTRLSHHYGAEAGQRLQAWQSLIATQRERSPRDKLEAVNRFFNRLSFRDDQLLWGQRDYWATPIEFLVKNAGDCEDFSIAKYFTLRELGIPQEQMRLAYVKATRINQAHMVLSYYARADAEPLILDNLDKRIKPASQRPDLLPAYSFNGDSLWKAKVLSGTGRVVGKTGNLRLWRQLMSRMRSIGKDQ